MEERPINIQWRYYFVALFMCAGIAGIGKLLDPSLEYRWLLTSVISSYTLFRSHKWETGRVRRARLLKEQEKCGWKI